MASRKRRQSLVPSDLSNIAKKSKAKDDSYRKDNLLCELTKKAGLTLKNGKQPSVLDVSKAVFQKQLGLLLKNHSGDLLEDVETFLEEFGEYIDDQQRFHKSLQPCTVSDDSESTSGTVADSVLRLFLGVDVIQSPLMTLLLEKLQEFVGEEEDFIFHLGQKVYVPRLVLSQFRFLDRIVDGKELTKKLMEILGSSCLDVQKEIIACLPDIVEDSEHGEVAKKLRDELMSNKELTCPVIDALTYLSIPQDLVTEIRNSVLDMLKSFSICDLPIVVNFLLESITANDAQEVVTEIRSKVDFTSSSKLPAEELERVRTNIKLTVDALKGRMQFQRFVAEAWIKVIGAAKDSKVLDVFVLLILHWMNHKKAVESLVRNRIRAGLFTDFLLTKAFSSYSQVVREYFPSLQCLAQALLRSPEIVIGYCGSSVYSLAFTTFDAYCQQEIVGSLVTHIGSGFTGEIEAALDILADLVKKQPQVMARYAVFVKGVLDYLDHNNLTVGQIRKLYLLLAQLAYQNKAADGSYLQDDLHIIIRKQLTSTNSRYKRMGVTGAISVVHALASDTSDSEEELPADSYKQVIELLELVHKSGRRDPEMTALFLDSLATTIDTENLYSNVENWVAGNMVEAFEENYVMDVDGDDTELKEACPVTIESTYDLNKSESTIVINLVDLAQNLYDRTARRHLEADVSALCLCPLFHLVAVCTKKQSKGDLEAIDALLGCPVYMVEKTVSEKMATMSRKEKDIVCASVFLCINWFREIINSFASMSSAEVKGKVMMRLKHVCELTTILEKCLLQHPSFQPPPASFDLENSFSKTDASTSSAKPSAGGAEKKKGKKGGGKGKKGKENLEVSGASQLDKTNTQGSQALQKGSEEDSSDKEDQTMNMSVYRQYFRELDISVFTILKAGLVTRAALDSEMNTKATEQLQIGLPELQFLLEDLSLKLSHALVATATKRRSFLKTKSNKTVGFSSLDTYSPAEVAERAVKLLPCLLDHLEEACTFFQTLVAENDGVEDGPGRFTPEALAVSACYHLTLQCLLSLFSWNGFASDTHKPLLKEALLIVFRRMRASQDQSSFVSQQDSLSCTFQYLSNFVETIPTLEAAVTLLKLLAGLAERAGSEQMNVKLTKQAKAFLKREWRGADGERLKGAKHNELLLVVVKTYIVYCSEPLDALEEITTKGLAELANEDKDGCAEEFVSLNRHSFSTFYKVVLTELISHIKQIPALKKNDSEQVKEDRLLSWMMAVKVLHVAVSLIKVFSARGNLSAALKFGRQFVEIFLRLGMPLLDVTFRRHHEEVEKLLRSLQQSTRMLHHMCGHSKINKDVALINQVPMLKRSLEAFVYRVKAMLTLNNCQDAFWMGNLKNRTLKGEEILTQQSSIASSGETTANEDADENEEENQGDEDEDGDSEVELEAEVPEQETNADGGSYSEIF
ncbi:Fanconi anemia group D2 protein [Aplysia californica]|uniref:Fanconi anemia group D2 protein n=1 Tax=Aplysia californica TaxID=6500 RepID=A0ABM0K350_APLCA|nr:Fanconi anemia group D2 protein [Aplysia californica]